MLTGSHPEYHTEGTLDALQAYTESGGRLMYLGGNGFYWRVALSPKVPGAIEVRRTEGGIRTWAAEPGEYYHSFDGAYGGLWRRSDRPPNLSAASASPARAPSWAIHYRQSPAARDNTHAWVFEGVKDELFGGYGFSGGGAAGFELDRLDHRLGSPLNAVVLASSEGHDRKNFVVVHEERLGFTTTIPGQTLEQLIRADMTYIEKPKGGAVFSVGSITYCGSLPHNKFDNDVSRLTFNVVNRFGELGLKWPFDLGREAVEQAAASHFDQAECALVIRPVEAIRVGDIEDAGRWCEAHEELRLVHERTRRQPADLREMLTGHRQYVVEMRDILAGDFPGTSRRDVVAAFGRDFDGKWRRRLAGFHIGSAGRGDLEAGREACLASHLSKRTLGHRRAADIGRADKEDADGHGPGPLAQR